MLKIFDLLKNLVKFFEIVIIFFAMIMILYWIQNLIGVDWAFLRNFVPILDFLIFIANYFIPDKFVQYQYVASLLLLGIFYFLNKRMYIFVGILENIYLDINDGVKKFQEKRFNNSLMKTQQKEQSFIKKYVVYVSTTVNNKKTFGQQVSLDEQNKIMNKFLIEKTSVLPEVFECGFLYKFNNFDSIDDIINIFYKLLQSNTPLDYLIVVHAYNSDFKLEVENLKRLIALNIINKIYFSSETSYRYRFNKNKRYKISQIGIFQKDGSSIEVLYFDEDNLL